MRVRRSSILIAGLMTLFLVFSPPAIAEHGVAFKSTNWAGYVADKGGYTAVRGTWTVPAINPGENPGMTGDAAWVGIGGFRTKDLIQAGTMALVSPNGQVKYEAWFEKLPEVAKPVSLRISPGDSITASVEKRTGKNWFISITNNTTKRSFTTTTQYNSSLSSAEWVEEMLSTGQGQTIPLHNFGRVVFTSSTVVKDGRRLSIAAAGAHPVNMVNGEGEQVALPTPLSANGFGFSVTHTVAQAVPARGTFIRTERSQLITTE